MIEGPTRPREILTTNPVRTSYAQKRAGCLFLDTPEPLMTCEARVTKSTTTISR